MPKESCYEVKVPKCQKVPKKRCQRFPIPQCHKIPEQICAKMPNMDCQDVIIAPKNEDELCKWPDEKYFHDDLNC